MNILHFNNPEEGFVWIAVLSIIAAVLWVWESKHPDYYKRRRY